MPAFAHERQPGAPRGEPLDWFSGEAGSGLLTSEVAAVERVLAACPALPWLWLGVPAAVAPSAHRGVRLQRSGSGFAGDVRCRLPLPVASECFGAIFLQHVLDDRQDAQVIMRSSFDAGRHAMAGHP